MLLGNRPACHAMQLWTYVQWIVERAHLTGNGLAGISADIQKAFNHLPREVVLSAGVILGIPMPILRAWTGALTNMHRRFQIRSDLGPPVGSHTGCPEGCSMSCIGMMIINFLFHHWIEHQYPMAKALSYVDDWQIVTTDHHQLAGLNETLQEFTGHVDLLLDPRKTYSWATTTGGRKELKSHRVNQKHHGKSLGAQMQFTKSHHAAVVHERLAELVPLWKKLQFSFSPYMLKVRVLSRAAWPKGLHGSAATNIGQTAFTSLRSGAMRGINAEGAGCNSWVQLGLIESTEADPQYWVILDTIRSVRMCHSEDSLAMLLDVAVQQPESLPRGGPTHALVNRLQWLGWELRPGARIQDLWGEFSLFESSFPEIKLRAQRAWQLVVGSKVADRPLFSGIEQVDVYNTRKFLALLTPSDQALYRKALNGASFTNDVCCYFSPSGSTACKFCGALDSRHHRFWQCPIFTKERSHCGPHLQSWLHVLPKSVSEAGWFPKAPTSDRWWELLQEQEVMPCRALARDIARDDHWIDVFTDGSCMFPSEPAYRFASWAVCVAGLDISWEHSDVIGAGPLPGILQSAFRAEMYAILQAVRWAVKFKRKLRVWCDCLGVVDRVQSFLHGTWKTPINAANADLWSSIEEAIGQLGAKNMCITKVAAHQSEEHATTSFQSWVCLHNHLVDRAARLANICRPSDFWEFFYLHREQVESHYEVGVKISHTILAISRLAVSKEAMQQGEQDDEEVGQGEQGKEHLDRAAWTFATPRATVPSVVAERYGFRIAAIAKAWLDEGITDGHRESHSPQWISWHQLYVDFQLRTGEIGPIYERKWLDSANRPNLQLRTFRFRKRSAWFAQLVKQLMRYEPYEVSHSRCRPHSVAFALHTGCICIQWQPQRLLDVENWVSARLRQAAKKDGASLDSLPNAKMLEKWHSLEVSVGPLGM